MASEVDVMYHFSQIFSCTIVWIFTNWGILGLFFFIFVLIKFLYTVNKMLITGFEWQIYVARSNRSTNCATTTAQLYGFFVKTENIIKRG